MIDGRPKSQAARALRPTIAKRLFLNAQVLERPDWGEPADPKGVRCGTGEQTKARCNPPFLIINVAQTDFGYPSRLAP